jgi:uncharacterized protein (TIGR03083 family)
MNAETSTGPTRDADWYADRLALDGARLAAVIERGGLDAPVAACPGWDVHHLVVHVGTVLGWAGACIAHAAPPASMTEFEPGDRALDDWFAEQLATIDATLRSIEPAAPTWHPFPVERIAGVWPRRLAHEDAIHRWDAEAATGATAPVEADLASDGIDEYFELVVPRLLRREGVVLPGTSFHVHCTDVHGEWFVDGSTGAYVIERTHRTADAALRGPAEALLLRLWGRPVPEDALDPVGDRRALDDWTGLCGM